MQIARYRARCLREGDKSGEQEKQDAQSRPSRRPLDKLGEPIIDPAPDKPRTWEDTVRAKALFRGGNWGMLAGLAIAYYYISNHSPLGFYSGNVILVLAVGIGAGFAVGGSSDG